MRSALSKSYQVGFGNIQRFRKEVQVRDVCRILRVLDAIHGQTCQIGLKAELILRQPFAHAQLAYALAERDHEGAAAAILRPKCARGLGPLLRSWCLLFRFRLCLHKGKVGRAKIYDVSCLIHDVPNLLH